MAKLWHNYPGEPRLDEGPRYQYLIVGMLADNLGEIIRKMNASMVVLNMV